MEFEKKINVGHVLVAVGMIISAVVYTTSLRMDIAAIAAKSDLQARGLQDSQEETSRNLMRVTDTLDELVRWKVEHEKDWAVHKATDD